MAEKAFRFPVLQRGAHLQTHEQQLHAAFERGLAEGMAQGKEQGLAQGIAEARVQAATEAKASLNAELERIRHDYQQQFDQLSEQLASYGLQQQDLLQQAVLELVCKISQTVLEAELSINPQQLSVAVGQALQTLQSSEQIQSIQVSVADMKALQKLDIYQIGDIPLLADDSLPAGTAQFIGASQLHLLDFKQRLHDVLHTVRQQFQQPEH